ncbi:MAG: hypothetical protein AAF196_14100 [Planctomycetota bacterium]
MKPDLSDPIDLALRPLPGSPDSLLVQAEALALLAWAESKGLAGDSAALRVETADGRAFAAIRLTSATDYEDGIDQWRVARNDDGGLRIGAATDGATLERFRVAR